MEPLKFGSLFRFSDLCIRLGNWFIWLSIEKKTNMITHYILDSFLFFIIHHNNQKGVFSWDFGQVLKFSPSKRIKKGKFVLTTKRLMLQNLGSWGVQWWYIQEGNSRSTGFHFLQLAPNSMRGGWGVTAHWNTITQVGFNFGGLAEFIPLWNGKSTILVTSLYPIFS